MVSVSFEISPLEIPLLQEFLKKHKVEKIKIGNTIVDNELSDYQEEKIVLGREEISSGKFVSNDEVIEKAKLWLQSKK